tara:strand:+ start:5860 stop:6576 length:717 start_codon:yes stop_codon:yes gene_type:complete
MINFFRKKRKKMADNNNTLKYARYAIGEIVLVVIGILIALSINNWNSQNKDRKYEKEILHLINQNLVNDSISLTRELNTAKNSNEASELLIEQLNSGIINDSLNFLMGQIITFERFKSTSSAFEVLKAKGIETISNKELQLALITYYDENLFKVYQSLNDVELSFKTDWMPIIKYNFKDFKWRKYSIPTDSEKFFNNPSTITLFKIFKDNRLGTIRNIELALLKISEVRALSKKSQKD